jgi:hypothetical protein
MASTSFQVAGCSTGSSGLLFFVVAGGGSMDVCAIYAWFGWLSEL